MKPDPSQRRPPPEGVLEAVTRAGRRRRARGLVAASLGLVVAGVVAASSLPLGDEDRASEQLAGPSPAVTSPTERPSSLPTIATAGLTDARCPADPGAQRDVGYPAALVPESPQGFDASALLVPDAVPIEVLACRYAPEADLPRLGQPVVRSSRELVGLESVPAWLLVPRRLSDQLYGCPADVRPTPVTYLVRLDYGSGRSAWLHTSDNLCSLDVTNGSFMSTADVDTALAEAFTSGAWPALPAEATCSRAMPVDRAGQELTLVPPGWRRVLVCSDDGRDLLRHQLADDEAKAVVADLNSLPTSGVDPTRSCVGEKAVRVGSRVSPGDLVIDYGPGRAVRLKLLAGCTPFIRGGSLQAPADAAQQNEILDLLED